MSELSPGPSPAAAPAAESAARPAAQPAARASVSQRSERQRASRQIQRSLNAWSSGGAKLHRAEKEAGESEASEAPAPEAAAEGDAKAAGGESDAKAAGGDGDAKAAGGEGDAKAAGGEGDASVEGAEQEEAPETKSVAAKLKGVHRKVFRAPTPPAPGGAAAPVEGMKVNTAQGPAEFKKEDEPTVASSVARELMPVADELVRLAEELIAKSVAYEKKYTEGWRSVVMGLLKQSKPAPPNEGVILAAMQTALAFQAALNNIRSMATLSAAKSAGEAADAAHEAAVAELNRWEGVDEVTAKAMAKNAKVKGAVALLGVAVGATVTMVAAPIAGPLVVAKIIGGLAGGAASGAAAEGVRQNAAGNGLDGGKILKEAFNQAVPGAVWGAVGGELLAGKIFELLPPELKARIGAGGARAVAGVVQGLAGIVPKGKVADKLRGKPDSAAYDPAAMATETLPDIDLSLVTAELEKQYPRVRVDAGAGAAAPGGGPPSQPPASARNSAPPPAAQQAGRR